MVEIDIKSQGLRRNRTAGVSDSILLPPHDLSGYEHLSDEDLVERCQQGEDRLFSVLVGRYQVKMYRLARKMGLDREDSKGITQAILLQAYCNLPGFQGKSKFGTWIYAIARNRCLNWLRRLSRRRTLVPQSEPLSTVFKSPEDLILKSEQIGTIHQALDSLPEKYRLPLSMFYLDNLSYDEIAEAMAISARTVETRLYRGRKYFKAAFRALHRNQTSP